MTAQKFKAILAKNQIARMIRDKQYSEQRLLSASEDIEKEVGEGNQPSIQSIIENKKYKL